MQIFTTYCSSPVGIIQIRCTHEHVLSINFVEQAGEENDDFPLLSVCSKQLQAYFNGERKNFDFAMKQNGTSFQQNVWTHLSQIPLWAPPLFGQLKLELTIMRIVNFKL